MKELEELEARIRVLEDIQEITTMMATYAAWGDDGQYDRSQYDRIVDLFADDARMVVTFRGEPQAKGGFLGTREGKEAIAKFYTEALPAAGQSFHSHMLHTPVVTVDGDTAKGRWEFLGTSAVPSPSGEMVAHWNQGTYEIDFVKVDGQWKFKVWTFAFRFLTPYEGEGWVKTKMSGGIEG